MSAVSTPLSPTERSTPRREKERAQTDRATLCDVLATALVCHLAVVVDGVPLALPTVFGVDPDGPDEGGTVYLHGSVASRSLVQGPAQEVSVTWTVLDGIVLARSGFNHSMNYRSAVVIGRPRVVTDAEHRRQGERHPVHDDREVADQGGRQDVVQGRAVGLGPFLLAARRRAWGRREGRAHGSRTASRIQVRWSPMTTRSAVTSIGRSAYSRLSCVLAPATSTTRFPRTTPCSRTTSWTVPRP